MDDRLTGLAWLALCLLGLVAGGAQRRGRDYYPANLLFGLCVGSPGAFWLFWFSYFHEDLDMLRAWSARTHASLWLSGCEVLLMLWVIYLIVRVNRARPGSAADLAGHLGPPTHEMVRQAHGVIERADDAQGGG